MCAPQVNGAARDTWAHAETVAAAELRSAIDNPVVLPDVAAWSRAGTFTARRWRWPAISWPSRPLVGAIAGAARYMLDPNRSYGLPPFLTEDAGVNSD